MSKQLRYFLHGQKDKYEDDKTSLYVTAQESTLWQKVGQQVLNKKGEGWRLLDSALVEHIPSAKREKLGINILESERVVDLIRELGAECVDGSLLESSERCQLLAYLSQKPTNEDLWKSLQLHETTDGRLESIEPDRVFLENPDFPLNPLLKNWIVLVKQNREIQQNWIPLWTAREAIVTILNLPNPHVYCELVINAIPQILAQDKRELRDSLEMTPWLPNKLDGQGICPKNILKFPPNLEKHQEKIAQLEETKYSEKVIPEKIQRSQGYFSARKYFTPWDSEEVIKKILVPNQSLEYWQKFCPVILDAMESGNISEHLKILVEEESWIPLNDRTIRLSQILEIVPSQLQKHLPTLVDLSSGEYIERLELPQRITGHQSFKFLKPFFLKWREPEIINFLLEQQEPHQHCQVIIDALSNLLNNSPNQQSIQAILTPLKTKDWLVTEKGNAVFPQNILHYQAVEQDIEGLLLTVDSEHITSSQLAAIIHSSSCWQWLTEELFITQDQVLYQLGKLLKNAPEYQLGEFKKFPLEECWDIFTKIDVSFLLGWNFARQIGKVKFEIALLPNLLGKIDEDNLWLLLQRLSSATFQPDEVTVDLFNAYLELAVNYPTFQESILPNVCLLNQKNKWQTPDKVTGEKRENINSACLLDSKQALIMKRYLESLSQEIDAVSISQELSANISNYSILQDYFRPWEQYCSPEFIGAFITLLMGNDTDVKSLAQSYLGRRDVEAMRQRLLGEQVHSIANREFHIYVGQVSDRTRIVRSVLGTSFSADLLQCENPQHLFVSELQPNTLEIELLPIDPERFGKLDLSLLLKKSSKAILQGVYRVNILDVDPTWGDLGQSDQLDIQVAKNFLLEGAPYIMRMLGVHERIPVVKDLLTQWDNLRHQKAELNQQKKDVRHLDNQIENLILNLSRLLEDDSPENKEIRDELWQAVREKIRLHGYRPESIPFELFQNADDATTEWMQISPSLEIAEDRKQFILVITKYQLLFIHAGRPIGCFQHRDVPGKEYRDRGFDRDLEKMLTFNISDKGESVTGKFGLGFKSIYLVCKQPHVLSKNLGFTVEGGLIPSRLNSKKINNLRQRLDKYINLPDATIVELELEAEFLDKNVIQEFQDLAHILIVFSRIIKKCRFVNLNVNVSSPEINLFWSPTSIPGVRGVEVGKHHTTIDSSRKESTLLCLRTQGDSEAALLLGITEKDGRLMGALPQNVPTFWVTAPTQEILSLGFALNANFDITTGRESLVKSSIRNRELADRIGKALGEVLCSLSCASQENWLTIAELLGLKTVDEYEFWNFLWTELAIAWQKIDSSDGREIIRRILGGNGGMGHLITHCKALPSGLYDNYRKLLLMSEIRYRVTGKLLEEECFLKISNWSHFQTNYQSQLIAQSQWENAKKLLGESFVPEHYSVSKLCLLDVLKAEIGPESQVIASQANQIGAVISKHFLSSLSGFLEQQELQRFLQEVKFMSKAETYLPSEQLLCASSNEFEERFLVGFAPDNCILHLDYQNTGLDFFWACRSRRKSISIEELIEWALQAETLEKRQAVHHYLLSGEKRDELAEKIYENLTDSWITTDSNLLEILDALIQLAVKRGYQAPDNDESEITEDEEDLDDFNDPNIEFESHCTGNEFSLSRSPAEQKAFAQMLLEGLSRQHSTWKGYIYHFTHVENAVSIIQAEKLQARNYCPNFCDSAGSNLIGQTVNDVKNFARFYFRPKTPTQWHNEALGKRRNNIYALCPVPIFFRFNLKKVLQTQGSRCALSNGNLASASSNYGNTANFVEQYFDFDNVYSTIKEVGQETFMRAAQQEFIVHHCLDFTQLNLEDITIVCRTEQDRQTLLNLVGKDSKYASQIKIEEDAVGDGLLFNYTNPNIQIYNDNEFIDIKIEKYDQYAKVIDGNLILSFSPDIPLERKIVSPFSDISQISLGESITVSALRSIKLQSKPDTQMSVYFEEYGKRWLIYKNEH
ncbi:DUF4433 domain-containing protein [Laspinema olomoucense]|uniref:DUF4433 domain-containing protein n=1 Tax=Laspinema olomoucense TaxID=3231600 RepID=UPI0021BA8D1F|nr:MULTISPECIES: DUF4433 domain-containing protein [unclassified Laspinema]MCT7973676.1 DUF4433 domain-containing protein [Laspinema sp. D3d]MCT7996270.1 DUF4433 domain-containing protein [Laspinema sp. D3c]